MEPRKRIHPNVVVREASPNYSQRLAVPLCLIVVHSTESHNYAGSPADLKAVAGWFANRASQVSAHVIVDGDGHSARCVQDGDKAWHGYLYNSYSLGIEQVGFAAQGKDAWLKDDDELHETARWIARWSVRYTIPIRHGQVAKTGTPRIIEAGVVTHADLGANGGGHVDPGSYPLVKVLDLAQGYKHKLQADRKEDG